MNVKVYVRDVYWKTMDKISEYTRQWNRDNPDKHREYNRRWRDKQKIDYDDKQLKANRDYKTKG